ncbi:MAG TPA: aspartate-semialdehyde dehydrogenase [Rhodospirillaceae bacterium]|jgi:aspartate-semialdehyde dehydrogenase|nr:aspartate-semialdehyde dehydrogenase [Alphaproteobacteria bacterium]HBH26992.1 aspartate-semialdehyde dehydrogenase [Rhodospirillaceae bacterium]
MTYTVAVVGATGNVGRAMLSILAERNFPAARVVPLASERSVGRKVSFGDRDLTVDDLATYDFSGTDIVLSSPGAKVSATFAPHAAAAGAVVIDNTSHFRMHEGVPLVVPEVNPDAALAHKGIIANPNCSTIQMVVALAPIHRAAGVKRVVVCTYQSVSGSGKSAMDELYRQTKAVYENATVPPQVYAKPIAFNVLPHIDVFLDSGMTKEEWKMVAETQKILDPAIKVCASCARVPAFIGHAEYINVELSASLSVDEARSLWRAAPGCAVVDLDSGEDLDAPYITPKDAQGEDPVYISRVRADDSVEHGLNFWCVADNLRKGAALNAVQIAELLVAQGALGKGARS